MEYFTKEPVLTLENKDKPDYYKKIDKSSLFNNVNKKIQRIVGSRLWLVIYIKMDITFSLFYISIFLTVIREVHLQTLYKIP